MKEYYNKNTSIVYHDCNIDDSVIIGHHVLIRERCKISYNVRIGSYTELSHDVRVDNDVQIHSGCFISEGTVIMEKSWIGPHTKLINDDYPMTGGRHRKPLVIGKNVIVGANCILMPGVIINSGAIIGAGSVVIKDVPAGEVWAGNPAMFIKHRKDIKEYGD